MLENEIKTIMQSDVQEFTKAENSYNNQANSKFINIKIILPRRRNF